MKMYKCDCGKDHVLNDNHYKLITEGKEIHLCCVNCNWGIIVGAEYSPEEAGLCMYSYNVENQEDTIGKITSFS
jgi:hypothetical protein